MKTLLSIAMLCFSTLGFAGDAPAGLSVVKGEVLEVQEVESYTYLRLKTSEGEIWAAVGKAPVAKGAQVVIENAMTMSDFESKSLKKTFKTIIFGTLGGAGVSAAHAAKPVDVGDVKVSRATGANAYTVAEIVTKAKALKDKQVVVRGKVVKYNAGIMGKNWVHLRDGTGSEGSNDILVTTQKQAKVGDVVTVKGVVRNDKDFGAGYLYKVLIEEATLQK